jgi:hypothetical protein
MIEETLENLLHEHEMVVVPGLGAFLTQPLPAEIDFGSHTISPPAKAVVFNPKLQAGGSMLIETLAQNAHISEEMAREKVENYTSLLKETLSAGGKASIGQLGELWVSADGTLQFVPGKSANLDPESFGLPTLEAIPVALQVRKQGERKPFVVPIDPSYSADAKRRSKAKVKTLVTRVLPVAASLTGIMLAGAAIYWLNTSRPATDLAGFSPVPPRVETTTHQAEVLTLEETPAVETIVEKTAVETPAEATLEEPQAQAPAPTMTYFVVAGSFLKTENLLKMKSMLEAKGLDAIELEDKTPTGATRVAAAHFHSKDEARQFIAEHQQEFEEVLWVFAK